MDGLRQAFVEYLGGEAVAGEDELSAANRATFAGSGSAALLIYPRDVRQVQAGLRLAAQLGVTVSVVSGGKNWGYGSRRPVEPNVVLMSLQRMQAIVDYDERLGYVRVQAGVTFGQLNAFLMEQGSSLMLTAPASTPEASVVGNALERGIHQGVRGDFVQRTCAYEVVLPSGELLRTGMGAEAQVGAWHDHAVGADGQALWVQSSLGVVTAMTVLLDLFPEYWQGFSCGMEGKALPEVVDAAQALMRGGLVNGGCTWMNADRLRAAGWGEGGLPAWRLESAYSGHSVADVRERQERVEEALSGQVEELVFQAFNEPNAFFTRNLQGSLVTAYGGTERGEEKMPMGDLDPDRDGCGVIWCAPLLPFRGEAVKEMMVQAERILSEAGWAVPVSVQGVQARSLHAVIGILFDRENAAEDEAAVALYQALREALVAVGYWPYRLAMPWSGLAGDGQGSAAWWKKLLDGEGVMARGRYDG